MSALAKSLTIGALVSASLAAPIAELVSYVQTKPSSAALMLITNPVAAAPPLAETITEPDAVAVEQLPLTRPLALQRSVAVRPVPPSDPAEFEVHLPTVDRAANLGAHYARSPSVHSSPMPAPIPTVKAEDRVILLSGSLTLQLR